MKNQLLSVMLVSITVSHAFAQQTETSVFDPGTQQFQRRFMVSLKKAEGMEVQVTSLSDLDYISNLDSILLVFFRDIETIKDSLGPAVYSRHVDYIMEPPTMKMIRIRSHPPGGSFFAMIQEAPVLLKMDQDTVVITGQVHKPDMGKNKDETLHYFRLVFFLNDINDLRNYMNGYLMQEIKLIRQHVNDTWELLADGRVRIKNYPEISATDSKGYLVPPDFPVLRLAAGIQNYRKFFVPSLNAAVVFTKHDHLVKRLISAGIELHFDFGKDSVHSNVHPDLFITMAYEALPAGNASRSTLSIYPAASLAYLVKRSAAIYDRNVFRLGFGHASLFTDKTQVAPFIYFNNFFKNISPSVRLTQRF